MDSRPEHWTDADCALAGRVNDWLGSAEGRTKAGLARAAGISAGTATQVLAGTYPSSPTGHLRALRAAAERMESRREEPSDIPWRMTSVAKEVHDTVRRCHLDRDLGLYAGRVGIGKTAALRRYAGEHPGAATLLEAYPGATAPVALRLLARALGLDGRRRSVADLTAELAEALAGGDRVVLVDEAETLAPQALLHLRRISDAAGVGVCLVGTPALLGLVRDPDGVFGQISSRIGFWPPIRRSISEEDARLLAEAHLGEAPDAEAMAALWAGCGGSARALRNLVRSVSRHCRRQKAPLTRRVVEQVDRSTMGGRRLAA